jgi:hypothetical protein
VLDCDEQLLGSKPTTEDSDSDGIPDGVEWRLGGQPATDDLQTDPDNDGVKTGLELRMHSDPLAQDSTALASGGYRYHLEAEGPPDPTGRQCYRVQVDNVLLAPTLAYLPDAGTDGGLAPRGAGFNDLYMAYSLVPTDDPGGKTLTRQLRYRHARFPIGGIKSPVDGVIRVAPEDFISGCGPSTQAGIGALHVSPR